MSELNEKQLEALARERAKIFSPGWFADLFGARLGFGDTFWLGLFGVLLFVVPAAVLIGGLLVAEAEGGVSPFVRVLSGLYGLWALAVLRALLSIGARGAWPISGMIFAAAVAAGSLFTAATF